jgi:superfamily II DNA or RNA helicase
MNRLSQEEKDKLLKLKDPFKRKDKVQELGYEYWKRANKRGTEECATGVGKTRIGLRAIDEELKADKDALCYIIVPTETLRDDDWPAEMDKAGYGYLKDHPNVRRLCYASLADAKPERDVALVVLDEIHKLTIANSVFFSGDWKVFSIMGLTATLPKMDSDDGNDRDKRILIDSMAPSVFIVPLEDAVELELTSDFEIFLMYFDLEQVAKTVPVKGGFTTEAIYYKALSKAVAKSMWAGNEKFKFASIQKRVAFLANLGSKTLLAKEIMEQILPNNRTIIFCGSIEQSKELCGDKIYNSMTDNSMLKLFQEQKIDYLGVVDALNEGKNVDNLNNALIVKFTSKDLPLIQRIGRIIRFRPGHVGRVIILVAKATVEEKWIKKALIDFDKSRIKQFNVIPKNKRTEGTS